MFSHAFTFIMGLVIGVLFLADSKLMSLSWINKTTGINQLSLNAQALVFAALAITISLTIRAIARAKGSQRINKGGK